MRRIIVSNLASLDGFFEGPNKELDWCVTDAEFFAYAKELLCSVDTLLFGARTYAHMAAYWPSAPADEIADRMNDSPKIVFSRTLRKADWHNPRLIANNVHEEVAKLKEQPGKDMAVLGSASLASSLMEMGSVDEYRVVLQPVLLSQGNPLFKDIKHTISLKLQQTKLFASGVVVLYYQKA